MKIFIAGATGVLGRATVKRLVAAGHEVRGSARSPQKAAMLRALGAEPVEVDLFDVASLETAMQGCDVAIHMATHVPRVENAWRVGAWAEHDRLRREGTPLFVQAAVSAGVRRVIKESVAFSYTDRGDEWITEDTPTTDNKFLQATVAGDEAALAAADHGVDGVVLRFGLFYGPETRMDEMVGAIRAGMAPVLGRPDAYQPSIHVDDAAAAVVAALDAPPGVYNVADEPVTKREWVDALKSAFGVKRKVRFAPAPALKTLGKKGEVLTSSHRISSARFTEATGWRPAYRSVVEGFEATARALAEHAEVAGAGGAFGAGALGGGGDRITGIAAIGVRAVLLYLVVSQLLVGVWATFFPRAFYDDFPGFGMVWVSVDGPYNEHLIRDVGAWSLGLAALLLVAAVTLHRATVLASALAVTVATVPHVLYHARHTGAFDSTGDALPSVMSLAVVAVVAAALLVWAIRSTRAGSTLQPRR